MDASCDNMDMDDNFNFAIQRERNEDVCSIVNNIGLCPAPGSRLPINYRAVLYNLLARNDIEGLSQLKMDPTPSAAEDEDMFEQQEGSDIEDDGGVNDDNMS